MKRKVSLLMSTMLISAVALGAAQTVSASDPLKIKLVRAKNSNKASTAKTVSTKTTASSSKLTTGSNVAKNSAPTNLNSNYSGSKTKLVVSTASAPKIAATKTNSALQTTAATPTTNLNSTNSTPGATSAPVTTTKNIATVGTTTETSLVSLNVSTGITYSLGAEAPKDGKQAQSVSYDIWPMITIGPVKTIGLFTYSQDLNESKNSDVVDPQLFFTAAKPIAAGDYLNISPGAFAVIPASKASKDVNQLKYSAGFNSTFALNTKTVGWDGVVLNYQPGYLKNENEFSTSTAGAPLTSYRIRQRVNFWMPISDSFVFKSRVQFDSNFSYENIVRNSFLHFEQVDFKFMEKYSIYLGHTNGGPTMLGENYENNLKFYDGKSSSFYLGLWADF